ERVVPLPTEGGDLRDVDRVPAVVAEAVGHVLDQFLARAELLEQLVDEDAVGDLVAGTDVVDLTVCATVEHELHAGAVVVDVDPVALVETVAVERDRDTIEEIGGEQRDRL